MMNHEQTKITIPRATREVINFLLQLHNSCITIKGNPRQLLEKFQKTFIQCKVQAEQRPWLMQRYFDFYIAEYGCFPREEMIHTFLLNGSDPMAFFQEENRHKRYFFVCPLERLRQAFEGVRLDHLWPGGFSALHFWSIRGFFLPRD